jgi:hypothetical protein
MRELLVMLEVMAYLSCAAGKRRCGTSVVLEMA